MARLDFIQVGFKEMGRKEERVREFLGPFPLKTVKGAWNIRLF